MLIFFFYYLKTDLFNLKNDENWIKHVIYLLLEKFYAPAYSNGTITF